MSRKFDRYMVAIGAGRHVKFRRLTPPERYAFFLGVLSVAAQAPVRGCLLVGALNAEAADIAAEADVHVRIAESALEKLRQIGVIYYDDDLGCERVHDFEEQWNPAPKHDATNAERQRRHRAKLTANRNASRNGTVTAVTNATVTPPEVEEKEEEKNPPLTPPLRRGELGQPVDLSEGKPNPRATGTNPRAIGRQHVQAVSANAAAVLDAPSDEERQAWERLHGLLARSVEGGAGAVHVMDAYLAGVDGGVFVIDAPTTAWAWLVARADRALPACCDRLGVRARLASDAEHEGLQRVAA